MHRIIRSVRYFKQETPRIILLLGLIGLTVLLGLASAWPMAILVDTVLAKEPSTGAWHKPILDRLGADRGVQILFIALGGMLIKVASDFVWMIRMLLNNRIRLNGTTRVRRELFEKIEDLDLAWHQRRSHGDTMYRVTTDTTGPWGVLDTLIGVSAAAVSLVAMTLIMVVRSPALTIFALGVAPFLAIANRHFSRTIGQKAAMLKRAEAGFTVSVERALGAISLTQAFGRKADETARYDAALGKAVDGSVDLVWEESVYQFSVQLLYALGGAVIFGYGGWLVYRDQFLDPVSGGVTCGDLIVFMSYLGQLWEPLGWVLGFVTKMQTHLAACDRVFEVLDTEPSIIDTPGAQSIPVAPRSLTFAHVKFGYDAGAPILSQVNARINPGEMVAFVGPSGVGKSTVLALISRFYDPCSGGIFLDEHDLRAIKVADLRRHVAVVSQESPLFPDTIAANLRYGDSEATDEELVFAARSAGAAQFIESLPDGYRTVISEGGKNLSGGQRQRLAIARALVSAAPILVFDEPTSALDPEHEAWTLKTLRALRGTRTVILVTHHLPSVVDCDRIFVLDDGTIAEQGTHADLLARRGVYARLYDAGADAGPARLKKAG